MRDVGAVIHAAWIVAGCKKSYIGFAHSMGVYAKEAILTGMDQWLAPALTSPGPSDVLSTGSHGRSTSMRGYADTTDRHWCTTPLA